MNKTFRLLFFSVGLCFSVLSAHADQAAGLGFDHKDWVLACDNTRTCRAAGYHADDNSGSPVSILLVRKAGPAQPVKAAVQALTAGGETPKSLRLSLNGRDLGRLSLKPGAAANDESGGSADVDFMLSSTQTTALLAALPRKNSIVFNDDKGNDWTLSDEGAAAVLLKMDEFQGRVGTKGALVRKGMKDESGVLAALAVPVIHVPALVPTSEADKRLADDPGLREALLKAPRNADSDTEYVGECEMLINPQPDDGESRLLVTRLSSDKLLVSALCWRAAYNEGAGYWVVNDKPPYKPEQVTNFASDYGDAADGVIHSSQKGRGVGDCWSLASWAWNGAHFVRTYRADTGLCRGFAGGSWSLPTLVSDVQHAK